MIPIKWCEDFAYDVLADARDRKVATEADTALLARHIQLAIQEWMEQQDDEQEANAESKWQALLDERRGK